MPPKSVLCLAAHPDDIEVYMGATLLRLCNGVMPVDVTILTRGEAGALQPEHGTRVDEARAALVPLNVTPCFLQLPDGGLDGVELVPVLESILGQLEPTLVFAPHAADRHRDHAAIGRAIDVLEAGGHSGVWRWLDARPSVSPTHLFAYDSFADKEQLIRHHASQIPGPGQPRDHLPDGLDIVERAHERDARLGASVGVAFAEPFVHQPAPETPVVFADTTGFQAAF